MTSKPIDKAVWGSSHRRPVVSGTGGTKDFLTLPWRRQAITDPRVTEIQFTIPSEYFDVVSPDPANFRGFVEPGTAAWREYFDGRKVIERQLDDGVRVSSVTRDITLEKPNGDSVSAGSKDKGKKKAVKDHKVYELVHLLVDVDLMEKFDIRQSLVNRIKAIAAEDSTRASRNMQEYVRSFPGCERDLVIVGKYAQSWKAARDTVRAQAARFPLISVCTDACFIGEKIFIYGPGGENGWRVLGPERVASLVRAVHRMVSASSPEAVSYALGPELTLLDIDVHDGHQILCPAVRQHVGDHLSLPAQSSSTIARSLSGVDFSKLQSFAKVIQAVEFDGEPVASAVRVSATHVLMCSHVNSSTATMTLDGEPIQMDRAISKELWTARCNGATASWHLRKPEVDERVVVCYRRFGAVHAVGPMRVVSAEGATLTYTKHPDLRPGMSGAAVVAVKDFALLAVHDGVAMSHAIGSLFSAAMFMELWTAGEYLELPGWGMRDGASSMSMAPFDRLRRRGLGPVANAAKASVIVASPRTGVQSSAIRLGAVVMLPAGLELAGLDSVTYASGIPPVCANDQYQLVSARSVGKPVCPKVIREVAFGEEVVIYARDDKGPFCTSGTSKVQDMDPSGSTFVILVDPSESALMRGGAVISMVDAAVVGMVYSVLGDKVFVVSIPAPEVYSEKPLPEISELAMALPEIDPRIWPERVQEAWARLLAGEASDTATELATVGASWLDLHLNIKFHKMRDPVVTWPGLVADFRSRRRYQERGSRDGLFEFVVQLESASGGSKLGIGGGWPGGKLGFYFEAVIGTVILYEKEGVVDTIVKHLFCDL